jgi:hypothetical protein
MDSQPLQNGTRQVQVQFTTSFPDSCRVKQLAALTALWIWIRRGRPSHKFDLRYFPIWIRLLHHGKLLDNSIDLFETVSQALLNAVDRDA